MATGRKLFNLITLINFDRSLTERRNSRRHCGPYQWSPSKPGSGRGFYSSTHDYLTMDKAGSTLSLRLELANNHLAHSRLSHINGYYCAPDGMADTLTPIIARLPNRRGFLAGWAMGSGMIGSLDSTIWESEAEAARYAHDMADRDAESERDAWEAEEAYAA